MRAERQRSQSRRRGAEVIRMPDRAPAPPVVAVPRSSQLLLPILEETLGPRGTDSSRGPVSLCAPGRVTELLATASREAQIIQQITACLEKLIEAQAARRELCALTPDEIHQAVESRHASVTNLGAGLAANLSPEITAGLAAGRPAGLPTVRGVSA